MGKGRLSRVPSQGEFVVMIRLRGGSRSRVGCLRRVEWIDLRFRQTLPPPVSVNRLVVCTRLAAAFRAKYISGLHLFANISQRRTYEGSAGPEIQIVSRFRGDSLQYRKTRELICKGCVDIVEAVIALSALPRTSRMSFDERFWQRCANRAPRVGSVTRTAFPGTDPENYAEEFTPI